MYLESPRLILRQPETGDVDAYLAIRNAEFVLRYNAMTCENRDKTLAQFSKAASDGNMLLLELKETRQIIGAVFTEEDSLRYDVASKELSYFLAEAYSRQGYMKEALHTLISHLFASEDLECVGARAFAPNTASRRLLESLGFQLNGIIPRCVKGYGDVIFDDTLYSLFRKDFQ